jgi:8-oxo-dGTP pyrophosphatase MutT (NUDIX family)
MSACITHLQSALAKEPAPTAPDNRRRSAVALLLRCGSQGEELFLVERAPHANDPWSGNLAFPGGKVEPADVALRAAAERETWEEVGISLATADYIGFLTEIVGAHLPVRVACFVYFLDGPPPTITRSHEIADAFWVPLALLREPARQITAQVTFAAATQDVPAILLPQPGKPVLWGITYRLLHHFFRLLPEEPCAC